MNGSRWRRAGGVAAAWFWLVSFLIYMLGFPGICMMAWRQQFGTERTAALSLSRNNTKWNGMTCRIFMIGWGTWNLEDKAVSGGK